MSVQDEDEQEFNSMLVYLSDTKYRRLPSVTLSGKLLVLGSLCGNSTWKVNIGEDGILLGHGHVELLVFQRFLDTLFLLLSLGHSLFGSIHITLVHVLQVLWVGIALRINLACVASLWIW